MPQPSKAAVEAAVEAMRRFLYVNCDLRARPGDVRKLRAKVDRKVVGLARTIGASADAVWNAIDVEATRRGKVCPIPGKDI